MSYRLFKMGSPSLHPPLPCHSDPLIVFTMNYSTTKRLQSHPLLSNSCLLLTRSPLGWGPCLLLTSSSLASLSKATCLNSSSYFATEESSPPAGQHKKKSYLPAAASLEKRRTLTWSLCQGPLVILQTRLAWRFLFLQEEGAGSKWKQLDAGFCRGWGLIYSGMKGRIYCFWGD